MAEFEVTPSAHELVLDLRAVEDYVRDAKLVLLNAVAYVGLVGSFAALRVVFDVPYLRAALGLYVVVAVLAVPVKLRLCAPGSRRRLRWFLSGAAAGVVVGLPVLLGLVELNRGTLFAEAAAALVALTIVHVVDRIAVTRAWLSRRRPR